jgi:cellobiose phosphorylase
LIQYSEKIEYRDHIAIYSGEIFGEPFRIFSTISGYLSGKTIYVLLTEKLKSDTKLHFSFVPSMGKGSDRNVLITQKETNFITMASALHTEYQTGAYLFVKENQVECKRCEDRLLFSFSPKEENLIVLGGFSSKLHLEFVNRECKKIDEETLLLKEKQFCSAVFNSKKSDSEKFWPHYQAVYSRFFGRTGVLQSSGAYGFRDQLQDSLIFLDHNPEITKLHILRSASHQFFEGDVMHWWHPNKTREGTNPGIRSLCSDDYLWLLYAVSEYLNQTSDFEILKKNVPFLSAEPLKENESERYFVPKISDGKPLLEHLRRAAKLFIDRGLGPNQLPYIGCGDWNDGMNSVTGESVWLGFFGGICLNRCKHYFDDAFSLEIELFLSKLSKGLKQAYNGAWFARAFRENGDVLGNDRSLESECSIDLITQAFSAFYYLEMKKTPFSLDENAVRSALVNSYYLLSDEKTSILRLFRKPFVNTMPSPGYIQRYSAGVRENGGQYTHAAVWFALALFEFGADQNDKELVLLAKKCKDLIDPRKNIDPQHFLGYLREPYVLCGDVYDAPGFRGRGGWSWYTGAAGWYDKLLSEFEKSKGKLDDQA